MRKVEGTYVLMFAMTHSTDDSGHEFPRREEPGCMIKEVRGVQDVKRRNLKGRNFHNEEVTRRGREIVLLGT